MTDEIPEFPSHEELIEQSKQIKQQKEEYLKLQQKLNKFVFNEEEVIKKSIFPFCKLNKNTIAYGLFLPRNKERTDKKDNTLYIEQIESPVLITSDSKLLEITKKFEEENKIKIENIPGELTRRYRLETIRAYLEGKAQEIHGLELYDKIKKCYEENLSFINLEWYKIHALWDMATYFFMLFDAYPILELRGVRGSGKSKVMALSRQITFNATELMTNPSESTLFRNNEKRGAKYIDEAEKLFVMNKGKLETDQRAEIINSSNQKNGCVPRQEKRGEKWVNVYYSTYSPTMIGSINGLYGATEDRAIIHITTRNQQGDKRGDNEINENLEVWQDIRDELFLFALQNWQGIEETYNLMQNETNFKSREFSQIWKPIFSIAKYLSNQLYQEVKSFAEKLATIKSIDGLQEGSLEYDILKTAQGILESGERLYVKRISVLYPGEHKPVNKTISRYMDKLGFMEFKKRANDGTYYLISSQTFEDIVKPICPSLFASLPSLPSQLHMKLQDYSEASVKQKEESEATKKTISEANEANEANEAEIEMKQK